MPAMLHACKGESPVGTPPPSGEQAQKASGRIAAAGSFRDLIDSYRTILVPAVDGCRS